MSTRRPPPRRPPPRIRRARPSSHRVRQMSSNEFSQYVDRDLTRRYGPPENPFPQPPFDRYPGLTNTEIIELINTGFIRGLDLSSSRFDNLIPSQMNQLIRSIEEARTFIATRPYSNPITQSSTQSLIQSNSVYLQSVTDSYRINGIHFEPTEFFPNNIPLQQINNDGANPEYIPTFENDIPPQIVSPEEEKKQEIIFTKGIEEYNEYMKKKSDSPELQECSICLELGIEFKTKCCKNSICESCNMTCKKCPFCRAERDWEK